MRITNPSTAYPTGHDIFERGSMTATGQARHARSALPVSRRGRLAFRDDQRCSITAPELEERPITLTSNTSSSVIDYFTRKHLRQPLAWPV